MQWITTSCYVSAVSDNSPGRVAALVCRQVSVTLAAIASFASRPIDSLLIGALCKRSDEDNDDDASCNTGFIGAMCVDTK